MTNSSNQHSGEPPVDFDGAIEKCIECRSTARQSALRAKMSRSEEDRLWWLSSERAWLSMSDTWRDIAVRILRGEA